MNSDLKRKIKSEVKEIVEEIEYEEYTFNKVFHSNIEFQKSYFKFNKIYEKYGKEAYLKYVPHKYKKQEIKNLINEEKFLEIYEHYGATTLKKLEYTSNITKQEINTKSYFKRFFIIVRKLFSGKFIYLPQQTVLALPEGISEIKNQE